MAKYKSISWAFMAEGAVRPLTSGRLTPPAAQTRFPISRRVSGSGRKSRCERRALSARIKSNPWLISVGGRIVLLRSLSAMTFRLACPILPIAGCVNLSMSLIPYFFIAMSAALVTSTRPICPHSTHLQNDPTRKPVVAQSTIAVCTLQIYALQLLDGLPEHTHLFRADECVRFERCRRSKLSIEAMRGPMAPWNIRQDVSTDIVVFPIGGNARAFCKSFRLSSSFNAKDSLCRKCNGS